MCKEKQVINRTLKYANVSRLNRENRVSQELGKGAVPGEERALAPVGFDSWEPERLSRRRSAVLNVPVGLRPEKFLLDLAIRVIEIRLRNISFIS